MGAPGEDIHLSNGNGNGAGRAPTLQSNISRTGEWERTTASRFPDRPITCRICGIADSGRILDTPGRMPRDNQHTRRTE
eukprot:scaffold223262_cov49-Tisochrysis_lutea.AAC.1